MLSQFRSLRGSSYYKRPRKSSRTEESTKDIEFLGYASTWYWLSCQVGKVMEDYWADAWGIYIRRKLGVKSVLIVSRSNDKCSLRC